MKTKDANFIICPKCQGSGKSTQALTCNFCSGIGLGAFFKDRFLFWGKKIGKANIKLENFERTGDIFINLFFLFFGIFGLISMGIWIATSGNNNNLFLFWKEKSWLIFWFWFGILSFMFIFYRLNIDLEKNLKIKKFKKISPEPRLPDNWDQIYHYKNKIDVSLSFSDELIKSIENSFLFATKIKNKEVEALHLFYSFLKDKSIIAFLIRLDIDGGKLIEILNNQIARLPKKQNLFSHTLISISLKEAFISAFINAYNFGKKKVDSIDMIIPLLDGNKIIEEIFYELEVDRDKIINVVEWFKINHKLIENYKIYKKKAKLKPSKSMNRSYTAVPTPVLDHFSYDLTLAAKWGRLEFCVGREAELEKIFDSMEKGNSGIIIIGEPGVGKKTIIKGIAGLMVKEEVPDFLKDKRLLELDVSRLIGGADAVRAEERMLVIMDEIIRAGNVVLSINNIESLSGITSGAEQSLELLDLLANILSRKNIYCFCSATTKNYNKYLKGTSLDQACELIKIDEPEKNKTIQMIESKIGYLENKYKIYFSYNAIEETVNLSEKFLSDKYLPEKAIKLLESASLKVSKRCAVDSSLCICTKEDIAVEISEQTGIPANRISEGESEKLLNLEALIHNRLIGQDEAVNIVANSLRRARTELRDSKRPIASFLFLGPTGVGKTELAKTVSEIYFGDEKYMIRLDMSEYQHPDSINKMIGDSLNPGHLTEAVKSQPFSLILLDEFEKAHPDILNLFLQVMDEGRLTDYQGVTANFTNSIIIATSNIGAVYIQDEIQKNTDLEKIKQALVSEQLNKYLKPELINRFDGIIVFRPLTINETVKIAELMLQKTKQMLKYKGVDFQYSEAGIKYLAEKGYDPKFGARPLRRLIQEKVEDEIAKKILKNEIKRRDLVILGEEAVIQIQSAKNL